MSQYDRKYDGPPPGELRRYPVPSVLPADFHENIPSLRKRIHPKQMWSFVKGKWDATSYSPFVGRELRLWTREFAGDHVLKRLKAILMTDDATGAVWIEDQATKCQLSPMFTNPWCLLNWLEYEGLARGFLVPHAYEHRFKNRDGKEEVRKLFEFRRI